MQRRSRPELYRAFLEFVGSDIQSERRQANKRMFSVLLWCFILPFVVSITLLLLVKIGLLPRAMRAYMDWLILVFPVLYSLYILSSEVLSELPTWFRRGGMATTLTHSRKDGEWRDRVCEGMRKELDVSADEWSWLIFNFRIDLQKVRDRTKHLTALAGAVFFLILQGIDSLSDAETRVTWIKSPVGWIEAPSEGVSQYIALGLVLILLYLSGNQTYTSLRRYLNCAELVAEDLERARRLT